MATRIPSITLNMNNPYSVKTHRECVPIWKKVNPSFKDLEHRPPFELAYACYLNLINHIKKSSPCAYCKKPLEGNGLYFPLEDHHIMPLPCCEKCCTFDIKKKGDTEIREMRTIIYVNKYQRSIKYYTWKMMVCANLVVPMYNKMMKEEEEIRNKEEENRKEEAKIIIEEFNKYSQENVIINTEINSKEKVIEEKEVENEINNYYFGNISEYDTDFYNNLIRMNAEKKKESQNIFMIMISFIATILISSLYLILNK